MLTRETFIGPWAGLLVSWNEDYSFDEATYREDVALIGAAGVPGIYTGGTTGEFYALEFDEFKAVTDATISEGKQAGTPVMIGCTSTYTLGAIRRARYARDKGADAIQIALPYWMAVSDDEARVFFKEVSRAVPDMPISIYETTRAKKTLSLEMFKWIHQEIPMAMMVKSNTNTLGHSEEGCAELSKMFNIFVGENSVARLGPYGAIGSCSSVVCMNPYLMLKMFDHLYRQEWDGVKEISDMCDRLFKGALDDICEREGYEDSAADRLLANCTGYLKTGLRSQGPYKQSNENDLSELKEWVEKNLPVFLDLGLIGVD